MYSSWLHDHKLSYSRIRLFSERSSFQTEILVETENLTETSFAWLIKYLLKIKSKFSRGELIWHLWQLCFQKTMTIWSLPANLVSKFIISKYENILNLSRERHCRDNECLESLLNLINFYHWGSDSGDIWLKPIHIIIDATYPIKWL